MLKRGEIIVDLFAGGGGASLGIKKALGREPDLAINHDAAAIAMHAANHPGTQHMTEDVWRVNPRAATKGRKIGLLWASPDCRHFSRAKGGKPVEKNIRSLAWVVIKWAADPKVAPRVIMLENVREFAEWGPIVPAWRCGACSWRGTEGQATMLRKRRCCPRCNSVRLRETEEQIPDPARKGLTFKRWAGRLRNLGYRVEWKNMDAADHGDPTHRRRLFLIARRDSEPIVWPDATHCDPKKVDALPLFDRLKPWNIVADCIDWSLPCRSIFERKRPLAEATMRRIAMGFKRYVLENPQPYIVGVGGRTGQSPASGVDQPSNTITGKNDRVIVTPTLIQVGYGEREGQAPRTLDIEQPFGAVVAGGVKAAIACPILVGAGGAAYAAKPQPCDGPKKGNMPHDRTALVTAFLAKHFGGHTTPGSAIDAPVDTITAKDHNALTTVFLAKHYGDGHVGCPIDTPFPTITQIPNQNQIVAANLIRMSYGEKSWNGVDEPLPTATSQGNKFGLIYSFLIRYFGTAIGQYLTEPMFTATGKDRFGLVVVHIAGEPYIVADIGMRMLSPRELARAQGFPDSYVLTGTKTSQVAKIGNSVCPGMARALVAANFCAESVAA